MYLSGTIKSTYERLKADSLRELLSETLQDYRISNEISSKQIEHALPALHQVPKGDLFAVGSTIGFYMAGITEPDQILMVDNLYLINRFNLIYEIFLRSLDSIDKVEAQIKKQQIHLTSLEKQIWSEATAVEKEYLQKTSKAKLKNSDRSIDDVELIKLTENLKYHYALKETYLKDQQKLSRIIILSRQGKITHLTLDVSSPKTMDFAKIINNWKFNFSLFYFSNITDWFPDKTYLQQIKIINEFLKSIGAVDHAILLRSHCNRWEELFEKKRELMGENGKWFYEIIRNTPPIPKVSNQ